MLSSISTCIIISVSFLIIFSIEIVVTYLIYSREIFLINNHIETTIEYISSTTQQNILSNIQNIQYHIAHAASIHQTFGINITLNRYLSLIHYDAYPFKDVVPLFIWSPYLNYSYLSNYISHIRNTSLPNYNITYLNSFTNTLESYSEPFPKRFYTPITMIAPFTNINIYNSSIYGFDILSHPLTHTYIQDQLWANGAITLSNSTIHLKNDSSQYGVILGMPSIALDLPNGPDPRDNIIGFNAILIKSDKLVLRSLPDLDFNSSQFLLHIQYILPNNSHQILHLDTGLTNDNNENDLLYPYHTSMNIDIINHQWRIYLYFPMDYIDSLRNNQITIVLIGTIITFCLFDIVLYSIVFIYFSFKSRNDAINHKYEIANNMLGYVNHEIRNPLNSIIGLVDLTILQLEDLFPYVHRMSFSLDNESDDSFLSAINSDFDKINKEKEEIVCMRSNLNTAAKSCMLLRHIVNDILDVRKLEEGKLELSYSIFSLDSLFKDVTKIMHPKLMEKPQLSFNIHYTNRKIYTDRSRLIQLLLNLISNSIKYTHNGGINLYVQELNDNKIKFIVNDSGIGIAENKKSHIFQPFEQLQVDNARYGGIGLGLYLCKMLVTNMQGTIDFESRQNVGSTFWIIINSLEIPIENSESS